MMTEEQKKALAVLVKNGSQAQAAKAAGVSRRTVNRWAGSVEFSDRLNESKTEIVQAVAVSDALQIAEVEAQRTSIRLRSILVEMVEKIGPALDVAIQNGDLKAAASLWREQRGAAMDALRAAGELKPDTQINVGIVFSETLEWKRLLGKLVYALSPYPEAKAAVLAAIESEGAA